MRNDRGVCRAAVAAHLRLTPVHCRARGFATAGSLCGANVPELCLSVNPLCDAQNGRLKLPIPGPCFEDFGMRITIDADHIWPRLSRSEFAELASGLESTLRCDGRLVPKADESADSLTIELRTSGGQVCNVELRRHQAFGEEDEAQAREYVSGWGRVTMIAQ